MMKKYMVMWKGGEFNLWNTRYFDEEKEAIEFCRNVESQNKAVYCKRRGGGYGKLGCF